MRIKRFINIHTILILVVLLTCAGIVYRYNHWGVLIDLEEIFKDHDGTDTMDNYDFFLPLTDAEGNAVTNTKVDTIVCFGNAPFADDRGGKNNLCNLIAEKTGATVYNCSIGMSFLAANGSSQDFSWHPYDAYNFYWLTHVAAKNKLIDNWEDAAATLRDNAAPEAEEVYHTLETLDFSTVDVIAIMYDATDYLKGYKMYDDDNPTNIETFTGNLEAGIELLKGTYPHIRIIVMSPTYAYAYNEETGKYISSDMYTYHGQDVLSTYAIKQGQSCFNQGVTFVDHLYGTITEDNADKYLTDNYHLNLAGRKLVADRFIEALNYYNE